MIIGLFFFRSTGATVVEMLTKSPPWHNLTDFQVMFRISIKEAPTYQLHSDISKQAQEFLDLIFTYDSLQRPSAMELIEHRWLSHSKDVADETGELSSKIAKTLTTEEDDSIELDLDYYLTNVPLPDYQRQLDSIAQKLKQMCKKYAVEHSSTVRDPDDPNHVLLLGENVENIPEEEIVSVTSGTSFTVTRQTTENLLLTEMLSLTFALSLEKKEWENERWGRSEGLLLSSWFRQKRKVKKGPNQPDQHLLLAQLTWC
ncbi:MAP3K2 [Bugula neritina]|uniref:non-specific serine/threonine protein kinase n=1 Tax=Bugula neritina TaxID=10212 RepID=A0A7J7J4Y4_BUGNE|nr:MAP3K2 [Bugula neritina]